MCKGFTSVSSREDAVTQARPPHWLYALRGCSCLTDLTLLCLCSRAAPRLA